MSGNETSNPLVQGCFNPQGENVNISKVFLGCTINENKSETQPNRGEVDNSKDRHDSQISELQRKIESILKIQYKEITLPTLPWLEMCDIPIENYTTMQLESENEKEMSKIINLENLFDNINEQKRKRILIESQPGYGKTTLAHKVVSDWSRGSEYVKHFKFAILIILREYAASSLKQEFKDVIGVENYDDGDFWSIINTDETLLIFDGLDEISGRLRRDIQEILHDTKNEYKMTIVTTCRVGLSNINRDDIESINRGVSLKKNIWNKKITILGVNEENQREFIEKFVDENDKLILMPRLVEIIAKRRKMFNSPLLLILLVYVTSENHDVEIETDTDLYKTLVDCIIRRSVAKKNSKMLSVKFTIFTSGYIEPIFDEYKKIFVRFGELCLNHILTDDLQFGSDTENEAFHQLGFLLKHVTKKFFGPIVRYEGFHLSILEFAAAVYLAYYFATNENRFLTEDIHKLFKIVRNKKLTSMVLPFLCDLLGIGISHLIKELSRYYVFFWFNGEIVEYLFRKCLLNNVGVEHFVEIIPPYFTEHTLWPRSVTNDQNSAKFVVVKLDDVRNLGEIPRPTHLKGLVCNGINGKFEDMENLLEIAQNIRSESLSFTINLPNEYVANNLKMFRRFSSDCKNLYFRSWNHCRSDFEEYLTNGILAGLMLNHVIIDSCNIDVRVIAKLIEHNHIESLNLRDMSPQSTKNLAPTIRYLATTTINSLTVLFLHHRFCLGWNDFTKNGEMYSKETNNANMNLEDSASLTYSNALEYNARVLFPLKPSRLHCSCCEFPLRNWENWDMILELTLTSITGSNRTYRADFSKFKSLKILTLVISIESELGDEASVGNIVGSIKSLNLARLTIKWLASRHYFYGSLIDGIRELLQNKEIFCSESVRFEVHLIEVYWYRELFDFETVKSALLSDSKIFFCIVSNKWSILRTNVRNRLNDLLFFNIKYSYTRDTLDNSPFYVEFVGPNHTLHSRHMLELTLG